MQGQIEHHMRINKACRSRWFVGVQVYLSHPAAMDQERRNVECDI